MEEFEKEDIDLRREELTSRFAPMVAARTEIHQSARDIMELWVIMKQDLVSSSSQGFMRNCVLDLARTASYIESKYGWDAKREFTNVCALHYGALAYDSYENDIGLNRYLSLIECTTLFENEIKKLEAVDFGGDGDHRNKVPRGKVIYPGLNYILGVCEAIQRHRDHPGS